MEEYEISGGCPQCGEAWNGYECDDCGFADLLPLNEYETKDGIIVYCSEELALERGYIYTCECGSTITWWEKEDHGMCIDCWHRKNVDK